MTFSDVHFSSKTELWETPQSFFDALNAEFKFTLDACATPENTKCTQFYSPEQDGLKQEWSGSVWCNPPYGRQIHLWIRKAYESSLTGATVVMLIPARTDTKIWHELIFPHAEVRFVPGRLKFGAAKYNAPFPCAIVVFKSVNHKA